MTGKCLPIPAIVLLALLLIPGVLSLSGCRLNARNAAFVRLINAVPDAEELTVSVDDRKVWRHARPRDNTGYQKVFGGTYEVDLEAPGRRRVAHDPKVFQKGKAYTVLAYGLAHSARGAAVRVFADDPRDSVPRDKARLRVINAAPGIGRIDVLFNNIVALQRLDFGARSPALLLNPGNYTVKVTESGGYVTPLIGPNDLRLEPGRSYTLVALGGGSAQDLTLEVYSDRK